ncbi:MAG: hypothetical protein KGN37_16450 [Burkholderiales bacterium]|nr:hypothetical protein [Burkholderiales bacterium]
MSMIATSDKNVFMKLIVCLVSFVQAASLSRSGRTNVGLMNSTLRNDACGPCACRRKWPLRQCAHLMSIAAEYFRGVDHMFRTSDQAPPHSLRT